MFALTSGIRAQRGPVHVFNPLNSPPAAAGDVMSAYFVVVPVLREAAILAETVSHLQTLLCGHAATVVVVTTAREIAESTQHADADDTVKLAGELARAGRCVHLHYPDPLGVKADQLNYAAARCSAALPDSIASSQAFLVCYDADSRPPRDSLAHFDLAIAENPAADVFHQSFRFELRRKPARPAGFPSGLRAAICDHGAGGVLGWAGLVAGGSGASKTDRGYSE